MILRHSRRREGMVVVGVAVSLVGILAIIALTLDGGLAMDKRRQLQVTADAAAYAGGCELFKATFTTAGLDPTGTIATHVKKVAKANGFEDGVGGVSVVVHIPPTSGPFINQAGHCEV